MENGDCITYLKSMEDISTVFFPIVRLSFSLVILLDYNCVHLVQITGIVNGLLYLHSHNPQIIHGDLRGVCAPLFSRCSR